MQSIDRFPLCLPYVLQQEDNVYTGTDADWTNPRNYDDDPDDPGGATMCGITHDDFDELRESQGLPFEDVRLMGKANGIAIYRNKYWFPFCPKLSAGLDLFFFDTNVNMGMRRAVMLLQASLGVTIDGGWGPITQAAVDAIKPQDIAGIITDEEGQRAVTYRSFGTFSRFGSDWIRRDQQIGAESLKMAAAA
jgi:lysozyme family protein